MLVKPVNGLQEGLLLGKLLHLDGRITANGEPMLDLREEVDLVWLASLLEDHLGPVALLGGEDAVGLGGRNGQRARDGCELLLVDKGRVGDVTGGDTVLVVPDDVLVHVVSLFPLASHPQAASQRTLAPKQ